MKIEIDIPKDFENHYRYDKFVDSLKRIRYDIFTGMHENSNISSSFEYELMDMFVDIFKKSKESEDIKK